MAENFLPRIEIDLSKIRRNAEVIAEICHSSGINIAGVTKGVCGDQWIAQAMLQGGVSQLADSRISNIRRMKEAGLNTEFMLLRIPRPSRVWEVVKFADISLNSEIETLRLLGKAARMQDSEHRVILMVDLGDRREGIPGKKLYRLVEETLEIRDIRLAGIGTNLACFGGVIPTWDKMKELAAIAQQVEKEFNITLPLVSGGNSANICTLMEEGHPEKINHLRIGEGILLGLETVNRRPIPGTFQDAFRIWAEVIELQPKPSVPSGKVSQDAFGQIPKFEDKGIIAHGLVALGRQDVVPNMLIPENGRIVIMGASSDHLIVDFTQDNSVKVGDAISFLPGYSSLLQAMTSPYVEKVYL
ncbi:MAG: alanine/ornithine racemase family PLP-dependent enzyme [Candidatus Thermoplasmatota archaeon]|nr:alanine/ornithine racemase family PLP-dependent enzyme [Candidatus Thermoplasmatota archaeon]